MKLETLTKENQNQIANVKFEMVAGALIRGRIRNFLKKENSLRDNIDISYEEFKSFLDSSFIIKSQVNIP